MRRSIRTVLLRTVLLRTVLLALLISVASGCVSTASLSPVSFYKSPHFDQAPERRVLVLPFRNESAFADAIEDVERIFAAELAKSRRFDVVPIRRDRLDPAIGRTVRLNGTYAIDDLTALSRHYGAEGVLVGTLTDYRAYPPLMFGLKVELISTRTGSVLWSADGIFDANERATRAELEDYHCQTVGPTDSLMDWEILLLSKDRFARFACHSLVRTLAATHPEQPEWQPEL